MDVQYKTLKQVLAAKPAGTFSIAPTAGVLEALKIMAEKGMGFLVVLEGEKLVGVFSERDYTRKVELLGKAAKDLTVREIMTSPAIVVNPDNTIPQCMKLISDNRIRHLPVIESGRCIGVLSIGDMLKEMIDTQASTIKGLEKEAITMLSPSFN